MARVRNFVFTANNYTEDSILKLNELECKYMVYGKEVGAQGTPHLQGFVSFKSQKTLSAAIKTLQQCHKGTHVEIAQSLTEAVEYCMKDGDFIERGTRPMTQAQKGEKGKEYWTGIVEKAQRGGIDEIADETPDAYIRYYRTLKEIAKDHATRPNDLDDVCGIWIYGPPGTGKSHKARNDYGEYYLKETNKWWDSYQNEPTVVIDEVERDAGKFIGHYLKKWADKYAFDAEVKGSKIIIRPERIIITSNYSIEEVFPDDNMMCQAIKRRFKEIKMGQRYYHKYCEGFNPL